MEQTTEKIVYIERRGNGMGVAGFVLSLMAMLLFWVPGLSWILWLLGLLFSIIGVCRPNRGLSIAGLVISIITAILIVISIIGILVLFS